MKVKDKK